MFRSLYIAILIFAVSTGFLVAGTAGIDAGVLLSFPRTDPNAARTPLSIVPSGPVAADALTIGLDANPNSPAVQQFATQFQGPLISAFLPLPGLKGLTAAKTEAGVGWPLNRGFVAGEGGQATILPGQVLDRYGGTGGSFLSPAGTPAAARSLAPGVELRPLNSYNVLKPFAAGAGRAAPAFNQPGLGLQFDLGRTTVQDLINSGHLKPIQ